MNRVKYLRVSPQLLLSFARNGVTKCVTVANPLPDDAEIVGATLLPLGDIAFTIKSGDFPDIGDGAIVPQLDSPVIEDRCPHRAGSIPSLAPYTAAFTRDDLAALLYDADRQPGRRLTLEVRADGTWEAKTV